MKIRYLSLLLFSCFLTTACLNNPTWVKYDNSRFNYTIEFPGTPKVENREVPSLLGIMVPVEAVSCFEYSSPSRSNMFMVSCSEFTETIVEENDSIGLVVIFDALQARLLNRFKGELVFERDITFGGFPTREFQMEFVNDQLEGVNQTTYRVFIKGELQFIFQTITEKEKPSQESIDRFMNSFEFTD